MSLFISYGYSFYYKKYNFTRDLWLQRDKRKYNYSGENRIKNVEIKELERISSWTYRIS